MKKIFVASSILAFAHGASAVDINEAMILAYKSNPEINLALEELKITNESMPQALSGMLPSVSASWQRGRQEIKNSGIKDNSYQDNKAISLSQPIFKGGRTVAQIKKSKNDIHSARQSFYEVEQSVLLSAVEAYMAIVRDQEVLDLNRKNVATMRKHLEVTKERFKLGEVTKTDVAEAEARLASSISSKTQAEGNLASSRANYVAVVGEEANGVAMPKRPIVMEASLDELVTAATTNNPSVKAAEYDRDAAKDDIDIKKSVIFPSVDVIASKERQTGSIYSTGDLDTESVAFKVSVPLYQSGSEYSQIRQAKYEAARRGYRLDSTVRKIKQSVISAYQDFQVAKSSITSGESTVKAAKIALDGTTKEAKAGSRTTLDILDAENELLKAKVDLVKYKCDETTSAYNLLAQIGRLTIFELGFDATSRDLEEHYNSVKHKFIGF